MQHDLIIIGAGPAGLSFALSLRDSGLKVAIVERLTRDELADPPEDGRDIALTHLSRRLMQQHGSWQRIGDEHISPIHRAEVVDGDSPYALHFDKPADESDGLGFLVANHRIRKAIFEEFETLGENFTLLDATEVEQVHSDEHAAQVRLDNGKTLEAQLLVAADTRFSQSRRQMGIAADSVDFGRSAIVCEMEHELDHGHTAFECFHYGRTLAILPMPGQVSSIVVTAPADQVDDIVGLSPEAFAQDIEQRLRHRLGSMKLLGKRHVYPLVAVHARRFQARRFALVGDAAVGMHPVTAHGFNLGLSGQDLLAQGLLQAVRSGGDIAAPSLLQRYQRRHMLSTRPLYHGTNAIVGLFTDDEFPVTLARKAVLRLSNHLPPVKWAIRQQLMAKQHLSSLLPI